MVAGGVGGEPPPSPGPGAQGWGAWSTRPGRGTFDLWARALALGGAVVACGGWGLGLGVVVAFLLARWEGAHAPPGPLPFGKARGTLDSWGLPLGQGEAPSALISARFSLFLFPFLWLSAFSKHLMASTESQTNKTKNHGPGARESFYLFTPPRA